MENLSPNPPQEKSWLKIILVVFIALLIVSNGVFAYLFLKQTYFPAQFNQNLNLGNLNINNANENQNININANVENPYELNVNWQTPQAVKFYDFFKKDSLIKSLTGFNDDYIRDLFSDFNSLEKNYFPEFKISKVGSVSAGDFQGSDLYVIDEPALELGPRGTIRVIRTKEGKDIILKKESGDFSEFDQKVFLINQTMTLADNQVPAIIQIPNSTINLIWDNNISTDFFNAADMQPLFKYNGTDFVYKDTKRDCFIVRANDGTMRYYFYKFRFLKTSESGYALALPAVIPFTFSDGTRNQFEYIYEDYGACGSRGCYIYPTYAQDASQFEQIGVMNDNFGNIYKLKDVNVKATADSKDSIFKEMYDGFYVPSDQPKPSYEEFLSGSPIIYWQDPLGGFLEMRNTKFIPAAECGKPVIYLYPEKTTDVEVKIWPSGGLKLTDPLYDNGWLVRAYPDGQLFNYANGQTYPYLFWEGRGLDYQMPKQGFVVAKDQVKQLLADKLSAFGLVPKEYNEFIDFWAPKMQAKPYYFITFVPQQEFDKLAPLSVKPRPDTIIRVFMDYQGLDKPISVQAQEIKKTERRGFTVVEWGGALH